MKYFERFTYGGIIPNQHFNVDDYRTKFVKDRFRKYTVSVALLGASVGFIGGYLIDKPLLEKSLEKIIQNDQTQTRTQ